MQSRAIRQSFLDFFAQHAHRIVSSSSLVPHEDPTLLFTNAGMNQFKDLFLGRERRDYVRATTSQKCMRVSGKHNDLDNVGPSLRHHTFFEMLGNFSFGDYFKEQAIDFAWTVLTEVWQLPADRLHASIFGGEGGVPRDDEAFKIWRKYLPAERIQELGAADNFWQMGDTGPCGRCSEIHFYRGDDPTCPEGDRLVEVWNNVFMEFDRQLDGSLNPLPKPSIDTGMGLERITAVIQQKYSNYDTDLFQPILGAVGGAAGKRYGDALAADVSMRVVADHLRAATFLITDGVVPSNEWRGYVLRKIMRRAMRHGKRLGLSKPFLHTLVDVLVAEMGEAYPELRANRDTVVQVIRGEEERFDDVLTAGLPKLEELLERASGTSARTVPGEDVFRLYDSLGMPVDFIEDLASERQLVIDRTGFDRAMEAQRVRARAGSNFEQKKVEQFQFVSDEVRKALEQRKEQFDGYTATTVENVLVLALFDENKKQVDGLKAGERGFVVTERTPFYLEAGGQVSDTGTISWAPDGSADVESLVRIGPGAPRAHRILVKQGELIAPTVDAGATVAASALGDVAVGTPARVPASTVTLAVDTARRDAIRRNHTATHLLHAALRQVLGTHVKQAGSLVAPERLRFDFVHPSAVSREELTAIERLVNQHILRNDEVTTTVRPTAEAIADGAMALFGEKYGDTVRVVTVPGFSLELCGGTHCRATGDIGLFGIDYESGVAAGVRRIEAVTGESAYNRYRSTEDMLTRLLHTLNTPAGQATEAVERLQGDVKRLTRELNDAKVKAAMGGPAAVSEAVQVNGIALVTRRVAGLDRAALRTLADSLKSTVKSGVIVLASEVDGKVALVVSVTPDLIEQIPAGQVVRLIAPIVGGGGGGRADFAEAGGKDPSKIDDLLAESHTVVARLAADGAGQN
jgi:alanyl-tRNA synthetase